MTTPLTVAYGDGIGPEIMTATLKILAEAGAELAIETIHVGEQVYKQGISTGIAPEAWESLQRTKLFLKAPVTTPQGGGVKSINVTIRKTFGLYANVRPCVAYSPFIKTDHPLMDVVIVRENEEDLYGGIEHQQTNDVVQCLKLITRPGTERIVRYAFEYARLNNRKKVSCFTKDNIMKLTDGLFHKVFTEMAALYPEISADHWIIDIGTARLANKPEVFDVIVVPNLYGDIISDVAAESTGSVGLGGSANIGERAAMFEAIHGSAPDIAGKNIANPSGLLLGAVLMLLHINQADAATRIHNAWLRTIEQGLHTADIYNAATSRKKLSTTEFTDAVIDNLGQQPQHFTPVAYSTQQQSLQDILAHSIPAVPPAKAQRDLVGVDIFIYHQPEIENIEKLASQVKHAIGTAFELLSISNRGTKVWPQGNPETFCCDHWCLRLMAKDGKTDHLTVSQLLAQLTAAGIEFIKIENLYHFNGVARFARGQGE